MEKSSYHYTSSVSSRLSLDIIRLILLGLFFFSLFCYYDNLQNLASHLLHSSFYLLSIIKAPKVRVHAGKSSRSPGGVPQQLPSSQWDNIIKFLDSLMSRLRCNHVCSKQRSLCHYCFFIYAYCLYLSI